jgi:hypothetical protein
MYFIQPISDIFRLENLTVIGKSQCFAKGLLIRKRGYIEFETLEKLCW